MFSSFSYFEVKLPTKSSARSQSVARQWASRTKDLWNAGAPGLPPATYVNYAFGDEPLESMYGYEPWRLSKLRGLKQKYDPDNRFRFYNPLI